MNCFLSLMLAVVFTVFSSSVYSQTKEDIAKAYIQAITGGTGSKVSGSINFSALGCTPKTVFDKTKCEKNILDGKDGKTFLMEAITAKAHIGF